MELRRHLKEETMFTCVYLNLTGHTSLDTLKLTLFEEEEECVSDEC